MRVQWALLPRMMAIGLAAGFCLTAAPAAAQMSPEVRSLVIQVESLRRDLDGVQRELSSRGGAGPQAVGQGGRPIPLTGATGGGGGLPSHAATDLLARMSALETELSGVTGRVEEVQFAVRQMQGRLDTLVSDLEFRLTELERGQVARPAADSATAPEADQVAPGPLAGGGASAEAQADALPAGTLPTGEPQQQYAEAYGRLERGEYGQAEAALRSFLERFPDHGLAGNAHYWLGETYYVRSDFENAAISFADGYERFPDHPKAPDNLLKLGLSLASLDRPQEACASYGELLRRFSAVPAPIRSRVEAERTRLGCS